MRKKTTNKFIVLLIGALLSGFLLIASMLRQPFLVDRSIVLSDAEMLFIMLSGSILFFGLTILFLILYKERRQLDLNLEQPTSSSQTPSAPSPSFSDDLDEAEDTEASSSRFFMLTQVDARARHDQRPPVLPPITLATLCQEFRHFAASTLGLYYDIHDIRRFIGGLSVSHIMILQGMSGTGKTSLAYAFGDYLQNPATVVPIQPMWKERTDLIGYYNEFTKKFNETTLLQKLYEASHNDRMYITVLDEMNIARVEYYFAEFLSLLELPDQNKRKLDVIADVWDNDPSLLKDGKLILPDNMWFLGTANNDDSTFSISDKVYDRAMVINLDKKAEPFIPQPVSGRHLTAPTFARLIAEAKERYALSERNMRRLKAFDQYLIKHFQITFGNRIMQQIKDYVPVIIACGGSELSALDDMMSKKVLRKLETKNMVYVKNSAPGLIAFIEELFGEDTMESCKTYIRHIELNV